MANHLTPEELSKELGIDRQEVIRLCIEESVPIYQGKIDKTLFAAQLAAVQSDASRATNLGRAGSGPRPRGAARMRSAPYGGPGRPRSRAVLGGLRLALARRRLLLGGGGDALAKRIHQIDHGSLGHRLRRHDLLPLELRVEHGAELVTI